MSLLPDVRRRKFCFFQQRQGSGVAPHAWKTKLAWSPAICYCAQLWQFINRHINAKDSVCVCACAFAPICWFFTMAFVIPTEGFNRKIYFENIELHSGFYSITRALFFLLHLRHKNSWDCEALVFRQSSRKTAPEQMFNFPGTEFPYNRMS